MIAPLPPPLPRCDTIASLGACLVASAVAGSVALVIGIPATWSLSIAIVAGTVAGAIVGWVTR